VTGPRTGAGPATPEPRPTDIAATPLEQDDVMAFTARPESGGEVASKFAVLVMVATIPLGCSSDNRRHHRRKTFATQVSEP
jgi:hypothetical protein